MGNRRSTYLWCVQVNKARVPRAEVVRRATDPTICEEEQSASLSVFIIADSRSKKLKLTRTCDLNRADVHNRQEEGNRKLERNNCVDKTGQQSRHATAVATAALDSLGNYPNCLHIGLWITAERLP